MVAARRRGLFLTLLSRIQEEKWNHGPSATLRIKLTRIFGDSEEKKSWPQITQISLRRIVGAG